MANKNKVWGQSRIKANGREFVTEPKSSLDIGGKAREGQEADNVAGHFSESTKGSKLECSILVTGDVSLRELADIDDATVTMEADTGQTYVINHAYSSETISVSEGKVKVTFMGPPAEEMIS